MSKDLSLRLCSARENKNLTQLQVAKLTGITNTTLSNYENATSRPDPDTLKLLAKTYNVTTDYLLGLSDVPAPVKKQEVQQQPQQPQDEFLVAFYDSAKELSDDAKNDVLRFVEFLKVKERIEKNKFLH